MILLFKIFSIVLFFAFISIDILGWGLLYIQLYIYTIINFLSLLKNGKFFGDIRGMIISNIKVFSIIPIIILLISLIFAVYLAYSCNDNKFNIHHILTAIVFHPFYIIYQANKTNLFGIL